MHITFLTRKSALIYRRGLRQRVASLTLDCNGVFAIRAYVAEMVLHCLFNIMLLPLVPKAELRSIRNSTTSQHGFIKSRLCFGAV